MIKALQAWAESSSSRVIPTRFGRADHVLMGNRWLG
jgi:hypothetical protein